MSDRDILDRLSDEADLCRNDGAHDIAALLTDAMIEIGRLRREAAAAVLRGPEMCVEALRARTEKGEV